MASPYLLTSKIVFLITKIVVVITDDVSDFHAGLVLAKLRAEIGKPRKKATAHQSVEPRKIQPEVRKPNVVATNERIMIK